VNGLESIEIKIPLASKIAKNLRTGDRVRISGNIYTARDAAHKLMSDAI